MKTAALLFLFFSGAALAQNSGYAERIRIADSLRQANGTGEHELLFAPKARTMHAGKSYLNIYQAFTFNFVHAFSSSTQAGLFFFPPIVSGFENIITLNIKHNCYDSRYFSAAAFGALTISTGLMGFGGVITAGDPDCSFNAAYLYGGMLEDNDRFGIVLLGGDLKISRSFRFIAEFINFGSILDEIDSRLMGIGTAGMRIISTGFIFDLSGAVPLLQHQKQYIVIPVLKASYYF